MFMSIKTGHHTAAAAVDHGLIEIVRATAGSKMQAAAISAGQTPLFGARTTFRQPLTQQECSKVAGLSSSGLTPAVAVAAVCCMQAGWRLWLRPTREYSLIIIDQSTTASARK
jgi:hypothetical protein